MKGVKILSIVMRPFGVFLRVVEVHCFVGVDFILQEIVIDGFLVGKADMM
jgi:hypothetical protein